MWETCKVREETNHTRFTSVTYFPCCLLMSKKRQNMHRPLTYPTRHAIPLRRLNPAATLVPVLDTHSFACMPAQALAAAEVRLA